jgi:hypothetical protein
MLRIDPRSLTPGVHGHTDVHAIVNVTQFVNTAHSPGKPLASTPLQSSPPAPRQPVNNLVSLNPLLGMIHGVLGALPISAPLTSPSPEIRL